nr:hypothetical protein [Ktedonobacter sp. SOSP1-52]
MTRSTEGHRLAVKRNHPLHPFRFLTTGIAVQVFQRSDMVNLDLFCSPTEFTVSSQ